MKPIISVIAGILVLSTSAFAAKDKGENSRKLSDAQIIQVVETTNNGVVTSSVMEKSNGKIDQAKNLADLIMDQHKQDNKKLKALAKKFDIKPQDSASSQRAKTDASKVNKVLGSLKGRELDRAYVAKQIEVQKKVLNELDDELIPQAQNADLKELLEHTRDKVARNLDHAKAIQGTVGTEEMGSI